MKSLNKINYEQRKAVYEEAIATYGKEAQEWMVIEEMSELAKEICKMQRLKGSLFNLSDEIADVTIMLEQLRLIYGINDIVCSRMDYKVERLRGRLEIRKAAEG